MQPIAGVLFIEQSSGPMVDASLLDPSSSSLWDDICTPGIAQGILAKVQAIPGVTGVSMFLEATPFAMVSLIPGLGLWTISGTDAAGLPFEEYAGDLATRETKPDAVDFYGGNKPGTQFAIRDVPSLGYSEVYLTSPPAPAQTPAPSAPAAPASSSAPNPFPGMQSPTPTA